MKLYDAAGAPNPRRVRWVMAEKGITDIEVEPLSLMKGEHKVEAYVARAGLAMAPALELDDGTVVTESVAICRYLEALHPQPNLFGTTPEEGAVIEMWTRRAEHLVANPTMMTVRLTHPALAVLEEPNAEVAAYFKAQALRGAKLLDARLAGRDFLAADRVAIADIIAYVGLDFGRMIRLKPEPELTNLARWMEAMRERPAARAGM